MANQQAGPVRPTFRFLQSYVEAETSYGSGGTAYPLAASARRTISAKITPKAPTEDPEHAQGTLSHLDDAIPMPDTVQCEWEGYAIPSGTISTAPDVDTDLTEGGLNKVDGGGSTTIAASPSSTTTVLQVADASSFADNTFVVVNDAATGTDYLRFCTDSDGATPGVLTITPPLPFTPATSDTVKEGVTYNIDEDRDDDELSFQFWASVNRVLKRAQGVTPTSLSLNLGGGTAPRLRWSGAGRRGDDLVWTTINEGAAFAAGDLTLTVANGDCVPDDVSTSNPYYFTIPDNGNGEEVIKVTAVSGNDLTVVRAQLSTSDVEHVDGSVIVPYAPDGTYAGSIVSPRGGQAYLGTSECQLLNGTVAIEMPLEGLENIHGDDYARGGYMADRVSVTVEVEVVARAEAIGTMALAARRTTIAVFAYVGSVEGGFVAFYAPKVLFEWPELDFSQREVRIPLSGKCRGTSGADEAYLGFA